MKSHTSNTAYSRRWLWLSDSDLISTSLKVVSMALTFWASFSLWAIRCLILVIFTWMREEERGWERGKESQTGRGRQTVRERGRVGEKGREREAGREREGEKKREREMVIWQKRKYIHARETRGRPHQHRQAINNSQLSNVHITLSLEREIIYGMD